MGRDVLVAKVIVQTQYRSRHPAHRRVFFYVTIGPVLPLHSLTGTGRLPDKRSVLSR